MFRFLHANASKYLLVTTLFIAFQLITGSADAQFTAGRLVVEQVGATSGTAPTSAATAVFLFEYPVAGSTPTYTVTIPTSTSGSVNRLVESGTATSDGMMTLSSDGRYLVLPGYDYTLGSSGVVANAANKVIGRADGAGGFSTTVFTGADAGSNLRSVSSTNGSAYWFTGSGSTTDGGEGYIAHSGSTSVGTSTVLYCNSTNKNSRNAFIYNGNFYYSTGSGSTGIYSFAGTPTASATPTYISTTSVVADPYGFVIVNNGGTSVMYIVDNTNKKIYKYYNSGSAWIAAGSVTTAIGYYGITGTVNGSNVILYVTYSNTSATSSYISTFTDNTGATGTLSSFSSSNIAYITAPANTAFRGISFAPNSQTYSQVSAGSMASSPLTGLTTNQSLIGFNIASSVGNAQFSVLKFTTSSTTVGNLSNFRLFKGGVLMPTSSVVQTATDITVTLTTAETIANSASATSNYVLEADVLGTVSAATPAVTFSLTSTNVTTKGNPVSFTFASASYSFLPPPAPVINGSPAASTICSGANTTFTVSATNSPTYQWQRSTTGTGGTFVNISSGAMDAGVTYTGFTTATLTLTAAGSATNGYAYTAQAINAGGTVTATPALLTVNGAVGTASTTGTSCTGSALNLTTSFSGGSTPYTYAWSGPGTFSSTTSANPSVTGLSAGHPVYTVVVTDAGSCSVTATTTATVNPLPAPVISASPSTIITGGNSVLTFTGNNGDVIYYWNGSSTVTTTLAGSTGTVTVNPTSTTTYSLTSATSALGCPATITGQTATVVVSSAPTASIAGSATVCPSAPAVLSFSGTSSAVVNYTDGTTTYSVTLSGATPGVATATVTPATTTTYSLTTIVSAGTYSLSGTATISVSHPVVSSMGADASVCAGTTLHLNTAITGGTAPYTYIWNGANSYTTTTTTSALTNSVTVSSIAASPSTPAYTVTVTDNIGCVATGTNTVSSTVITTPSAGTVTGTFTVCAGAVTNLSDATGGGTWSSVTPLVATVDGSGHVTGIAGGSSVISYTTSNSCGSTAATATVTVTSLPLAGTITGTTTVCVGLTTSLSDATTGGVWSSVTASVATVDGSGNVTGITTGTSLISYTTTNVCGSTAATVTATVNTTPATPGMITGTLTATAGNTTTLSDPTGGGTWSSSNTSVATINTSGVVTGLLAGNTTITYTEANSCGSSSVTAVYTVSLASPAGISGMQWNGFVGSSNAQVASTFSVVPGTSTPGITVSQWNRVGAIFNSTSGVYNSTNFSGSATFAGALADNRYVYFTITNGSNTEVNVSAVSVDGQRSAQGPQTLQMVYSTGTSGNINFGGVVTTTTTATYSVFTGNVCVAPGQTDSFKVFPYNPVVTGTTTGTYRILNTTSVTATYINGVTALSATSPSSNTPVCTGSALDLIGGTASNGVAPYTYSWAGPSSYSSAVNSPVISSASVSATGVYTFNATDNMGCIVANTTTATVNPLPGPTLSASPSTITTGGSSVLTFTGNNGDIIYYWNGSSTVTTTIAGTTATATVMPTSTTTYSLTSATSALGCPATITGQTATVTISAAPTASIAGSATVCPSAPAILSFSGTSNAVVNYTDGTTTYSVTLSGATPGVATATVTPATTTTYSLTTIVSAGTYSLSGTATISVSHPVVSSMGADASVCAGTTLNLNTAITGGTSPYTYIWNGSNSYTNTTTTSALTNSVTVGSIAASPATPSYTVMVTDNIGCVATGTNTVSSTVNQLPTASISGTSTITATASTTLSFTGTANASVTYTWSGGSPTTATLNGSGNYSVSVSPSITTIYSLTAATSAAGCVQSISGQTATVTVSGGSGAVVTISNTSPVTANVIKGTSAVLLQTYNLAVATSSVTVTALTVSVTGTYASADITNLKCWYSPSSTFSTSATLLSTFTTPGTAGSKTFPSFTSQVFPIGTGYLFITADVASAATAGHTINIGTNALANFTIGGATLAGVDPVPAASVITISAYSDPAPFALSTGNWTFTGWRNGASAGSYPGNGSDGTTAANEVSPAPSANMVFHFMNAADPALSATVTASADYSIAYNLPSATRITGQGTGGVSFVNTGSGNTGGQATTLGEAVLGLNTTGRDDISVSWTAGQQAAGAGRITALRAQYRVGNSGSWTDLPNTSSTQIEYLSTYPAVAPTVNFGPITLPTACENKPNVQVRWAYYLNAVGAGGARNEIFLDDITVKSYAIGAVTNVAIGNTSPANANTTPGTNNVLLQAYNFNVTLNPNDVLSGLTVATAGTYASSDLTDLKCWYSSSPVFNAATDTLLATYSAPGAAGTYTFPSFTSVTIPAGSTKYVFVTADIASGATSGNTINLDVTPFSDFSLSTCTTSGTNPVPAGGVQTIQQSYVNISNINPSTTNVGPGNTNAVLQTYSMAVTSSPATVSSFTVTTAGTYASSDITSLKCWYSASPVFSTSTATLLSAKTTSLGAGTQVFPSFAAQLLPIGTSYIFITTDIAAAPVVGNTINIASTAFSNIDLGVAIKTGIDPVPAATTQTITAPTVAIGSISPAGSSIGRGAINVPLQVYSLSVSTDPASLSGLTVTTGGSYATADITDLKCWYSASSTFSASTATLLSTLTGPAVAGTQIFPSFTAQTLPVGNAYIFVTADFALAGTVGNTINVGATFFSAFGLGSATLTGANPVPAASTFTVVTATDPVAYTLSSGNYLFNNWPSSSPAGTYPANMLFHFMNATDPSITATATCDYSIAYSYTGLTRISGQGTNGFSFENTGTANIGGLATACGEAVLAVNTTGKTNINVSWKAGTITAGANVYKIRPQYRIGNTGTYTDLPYTSITDIEYTAGTGGTSSSFGPITLPSSCENVPYVEIRWAYYHASGSGGDPELNVTNINVSGSLPTATITSSVTSVCPGGNETVSVSGGTALATVTLNPGAASFALDASGNGSATFSVTATNTYTATVTSVSGVTAAATGSVTVTVLTLPSGGTISGTTSVCAGSTTSLSDGSGGGVWSSSDATLATVDPSSGLVAGIVPGMPVITYSVTNTCGSAAATATVTVNALPSPTISGSTSIVSGSTTPITFSGAPGDVVTYNWAGGTPTTTTLTGVGVGGSTVTVTPSVTTTYSVTSAVSVANCSQSITGQTATITISSTPTAGISGSTSICHGGSAPLTFTGTTGATVYYWDGGSGVTSSVTLDAVSGTAVVTVMPTSSAIYTLTSVFSGGVSYTVSGTATITVSNPVIAAMGSDAAVCAGATLHLNATVSSGVSPYTYTWNGPASYTASTSFTSALTNSVTVSSIAASPSAPVYTVTITDFAGCVASGTNTVTTTVVPLPAVYAVTGGGAYCSGASGSTIGLSGSDNAVNYQLFNGSSPVGSPVAGTTSAISFGAYSVAAVYSAVATSAVGGCTANMAGNTAVTIITAGTASGTATLGIGGVSTFSATGTPGGTWSSSATGVATVNSSTGSVTAVGAGTTNIIYTAPGCGSVQAIASLTVTAQYVWTGSAGDNTWATANNWTSNVVPPASGWAQFATLGTATAVGINTATVAVGAIDVASSRSVATTITGTYSAAATMTMNGTTVYSVANTVISNRYTPATYTTNPLTFNNGTQPLNLVFNNTAPVIQGGVGTSSTTPSNVINITDNITSSNGPVTYLGNGTWNGTSGTNGGLLRLGGTNTFANPIIVGNSDGTSNGILELDAATAINNSAANTITINNNSQLYLASAVTTATYSTSATTLYLNGSGNNASFTGPASLFNLSNATYTWPGAIVLASNAGIGVNGASATTTLSGIVSGPGELIKSQGKGNLILTNASNSWSGGTAVQNGTVTVTSAGQLGTGLLNMSAAGGKAAWMVFNNASQTINGISNTGTNTTSVTATSNTIQLNGTALTINLAADGIYGAVGTLTVSPGIITGTGSLIKTGTANLLLTSPGNNFTGGLTINSGGVIFAPFPTNTVSLGSCPVTLGGGTLGTYTVSGGTIYSVTAATKLAYSTLNLQGNSSIVLDPAHAHTVTFAASNGVSWASGDLLTINGWQGSYPGGTAGTTGRIYVGTSAAGLTSKQLAEIQFANGGTNYPATILSTGELVPSASITVTTVSATGPFCSTATNTLTVTAAVNGFVSGTYSVQASNASGVFSDITSNILGTSATPTITATIPSGFATGNYTLRVLNGTPLTVGTVSTYTVSVISSIPAAPSAIAGVLTASVGATTTLTDPTLGGTWSSSFTSVATISTGGTVTGIGGGTATISYAVSNACGSNYATAIYTVTPATDAVTWNYTTFTTTGSNAATSTNANVLVTNCPSNIGNVFGTVSPFIASSSVSSGYTGASGTYNIDNAVPTTGNTTFNSSTSPYITFSVTPNSGYYVTVTGISFGARSTATGPTNYSISTSVGGFGTAIGSGTTLANSVWALNTPTVTAVAGAAGTPVEIRIYGYGGSGAAFAGSVNWRLDDIKVSYTVNNVVPCSGTPVAGTVSGSTAFCGSGSAALTMSPTTVSGLTYQWSSSSTGTSTSFSPVAGATAASYTTPTVSATTYYEVTTTCSNSGLTNISSVGTVTVNPLPTAPGTISGTPAVCSGATTSLTTGVSGGTWSSSNISAATINSSGVLTGIAAGVVSVSYTESTAFCSLSAVQPVTVTPSPTAVVLSTSTLSLCAGGPGFITQSVTATGGILGPVTAASGPTNITIPYSVIAGSTVNITGIPAGATINSITATFNIASSADGNLIINLKGPNNNILNLVNTKGGTSALGFVNTSVSSGGSTTLTSGTAPFTGTFAADAASGLGGTGGVSNVTTWAALYTPSVTTSANGAWTLIASNPSHLDIDAINSFSLTVNFTPVAEPVIWSATSGLYSDVSGTAYTGTGTYSVYVSPAASTIYTVSATAGSCVSTANLNVNVNPTLTLPVITGTTTVCAGTTTTLSDAQSGGTWSTSDASIASVNSSGLVTAVATSGTVAITYAYTSGGGCSGTTSATVTVSPLPTVPPIGGATAICLSSPTTTLTDGTTGGSYVWSSGNTAIATIGASSGIVTGIAAGTSVITYTYNNGTCTNSVTATMSVTATAPAVVITPAAPALCAGSAPVLLSGSYAPGIASLSTGTVSVSVAAPSVAVTVPLTVSLPVGASITSASVTLNFNSTFQNDYVFNLVAPNNNVLNLINQEGVHGAGSYTNTILTSSTAPPLSGGTGSYTGAFAADAVMSAGPAGIYGANVTSWSSLYSMPNGNWTLVGFNNSGFSNSPSNITSYAITINYSVTPSFTWSGAGLFTDAAGTITYTGTPTSTVYAQPSSNTIYTATGTSGVCTSIGTATVSVVPVPSVTVSTSGAVCAGNTFSLTATPAGGSAPYAYSWSGPVSFTSSLGNPAVTTSSVTPASPVYTLTLTDANTCSVSATTTATVNPLPTVTISGTTSVPPGTATPLTFAGSAGATIYYTDGTSTFNVTLNGTGSGTVIVTPTVTTTYSVTAATYSVTGCTNPITGQYVLISNTPTAVISGATTICSGANANLAFSGTAGATVYYWDGVNSNTTTLSGVSGTGTSTVVVNPTVTTTYSVTSVFSGGLSYTVASTTTITVNPLPSTVTTPTGADGICAGSTATITATAGSGYTYQWYKSGTLLSGATNISYTTSVSGTYSVVVSASGCPATSPVITVTINPLPVASVTGTASIVSAASTPLTFTGTPFSTVTYTTNGGAPQNFTFDGTGVYSVYVTPPSTTVYSVTGVTYSVTGCSNTITGQSVTITVTQPYFQGNIVIEQFATNNSAGNAINLLQYNPSGTFVSSNTLPTSGSSQITTTNSTAEGLLSLSAERDRLVIIGYDEPSGSASTTGVNRVIGTVVPSGIFTRNFSQSTFTTGGIRSGTSYGNQFYAAGSVTPGIANMTTNTTLSSTVTNDRYLQIYNGNLYFSTGSGTTRGVYLVGSVGSLTTAVTATSMINTGGSSSNYGFAIDPTGTIAYVADQGSAGVVKYTKSGSTWSSAYTVYSVVCTGLAVDFSTANPTLYAALSSGLSVVKLVDAGGAATPVSIATTTATSPFRGVMMAPAAYASIALYSVSPSATICSGGNVSLQIKGNPYGSVVYTNGVSTYTVTLDNTGTNVVNTGSLTATGTAANYTYSLQTITNPSGTTGLSGSMAITVNPLPSVASVTPSSTNLCTGTALTFTAVTTPSSGISYSWSGPAGYAATSIAPSFTPSATVSSGVYSLMVTNIATGCASTVALTSSVTVNNSPLAGSVAASAASICTGSPLTLSETGTASGTGVLSSYNWSGPNGYSATGTLTSVALTPTATAASGIYSLTVTYPGTGCTSAPVVTASVTVSALPAITGLSTSLTSLCSGGTLTLTPTGVSGGSGTPTYTWSGPGIFTITTSVAPWVFTPTTAATASGAYSVTVGYTDPGCGTSAVVASSVVTVTPQPAITAVGASLASLCTGGSFTLTATTSGGSGTPSYTWSGPGIATTTGLSSSSVFTPSVSSGMYSVSVSYDGAGCVASAVGTSSVVTVNPQPSLSMTVSPAGVICAGHVISLTTTTIGGGSAPSYSWSGPGIVSVAGPFASSVYTFAPASITGSGSYTVNLTYAAGSGCNPASALSASVMVTNQQWGGTASADWSAATNWTCGSVPVVTDSVVVPSGTLFAPVIGTAIAVNQLNILGATLTINSGNTLQVAGRLINNGTISGNGVVSLNGSSAQVLNGNGSISNLSLDNAAGATIGGSEDTVGISGTLMLNTGTLTTNGRLMLTSNATDIGGRIGPIAGSAGISGNVVVQQYVPGHRAYRFWAHPFNGPVSLSQLQNYVDVTGTGGSGSGFTPTATNAPSAFYYNPAISNSILGSDPGWVAYSNISNTINQYEGIRIFVRGAKGEGLTTTFYTPDATTIRMYGAVNTGNLNVPMSAGTMSVSGTPAQLYNMIGNPYPSPVDIGAVINAAHTAGSIYGTAFYVWDPYGGSGTGAYIVKPISMYPSYILQANASFQVQAMYNGATLPFTESNKSATPSEALLRSAAVPGNMIKLSVYDQSYHPWDAMYIDFNDAASDKEEGRYDAGKDSNPALNFYSISSDNAKLSIDSRPYSAGKVIPLGLTSSYAQDFIIKVDEMTALTGGNQVYLHDKYLKQYTLLNAGTEYKFSVTSDSATQGENRFELGMQTAAVAAVSSSKAFDVQMMPNPASDEVNITYTSSSKEATVVRVMNVEGVTVLTRDLGIQQSGTISIGLDELASGLYMVEITSGANKIIQRLVKE